MTFHDYVGARHLSEAFTRSRETTEAKPQLADVRGDSISTASIETPLGPMVGGATSSGVCFLEFTDRRLFDSQMETLKRRFRCDVRPAQNPLLNQLAAELNEYFEGRRREFTLPLDIRGTEFQERVWRRLLDIPYGATCSYEDLARRTGNPAAVRAVASANAMNRIGILIPCHRVVGKSGALCGYGGGLWRKSELLALERRT